jgi:tripartite-type tricarboxylate transporter receptor subunit TctC
MLIHRIALPIAALLVVTAPALAQTWPTKSIRLLVASPPGGPSDLTTRGLAQSLSTALAQPVLVENRPGADGMIAGEICARAPADGYTLCVLDGFNMTTNPTIRAKMPYEPAKDFAPIIHLGGLPAAVWAHPRVTANSLAEFLAQAKAAPGKHTWASFGSASSSSLYVEWLKNTRDTQILNVPYKSAPQAFQGLLAGETDVAVYAVGTAMPHFKSGKVKPLAINTAARFPSLPDTPTMAESGLPISVVTWFALYGPAGMPRAIVDRLNSETASKFLNDPASRDKAIRAAGLEPLKPTGGTPEALAEFMVGERAMYAEIARLAKIRLE